MPDVLYPTPNRTPELIETMRLHAGRIALWPLHRSRVLASAANLGYEADAQALDAQVLACIQNTLSEASRQNPTPNAPDASAVGQSWRIRLLLAQNGEIRLTATELPETPSPVIIALACDVLSQGNAPSSTANPAVHCLDASNSWLRHKTTFRPWYQAGQHWLQQHTSCFDLIYANQSSHLCEGSRSTIYVQDPQGRWLTPPVTEGLLPGVMRQSLLNDNHVSEARLSLQDMRTAPALRVSNALRGWLDARLAGPAMFLDI
ncbi:MAG: aminotransferase class IV [Castellaniella sp.]